MSKSPIIVILYSFFTLVLGISCEKSIDIPTIPEDARLLIKNVSVLDYQMQRNENGDPWDNDGTNPDIYLAFWVDDEVTIYRSDTIANASPATEHLVFTNLNLELEDPSSVIWVQVYDADPLSPFGDDLMMYRSIVLNRGRVQDFIEFPFSVRTRWEYEILE